MRRVAAKLLESKNIRTRTIHKFIYMCVIRTTRHRDKTVRAQYFNGHGLLPVHLSYTKEKAKKIRENEKNNAKNFVTGMYDDR